ncbi:aldehyde dehydrogenase [Candidatus Acetothermia bacterium]|nr:aldehyde dehydrogenase [Candidatus Acetothermia bacterium]MBI3659734.1 aldehyde dehydrogenase [Candidatus Acetothermia bacterium]
MTVNLKKTYQLFIGGEWLDSESKKTFPSVNPATGETLALVPAGNEKDIHKAVDAAWKAYKTEWSRVDGTKRGKILYSIAQRIKENVEELGTIDTLDNGKPITESKLDAVLASDCFEYYAGLASKIEGKVIPVFGDRLDYVLREPLGVVGQIIPWNFPLLMAAWKLAPALAAGNCSILKPAEQTPLSALRFAELIQDIVPKGTINIVTGYGPEAGAPLVKHPKVKKIAFTGSTEVGKLVMQMAADHIGDVTLELGGKSPQIVYPDANVDGAIEGVLMGIYYNAGQQCSAGSRLLLHKEIYKPFVEKLVARAKALRLGDPLKPETQLGPLVSSEQQERVLNYIEIGKKEGAKLLCGGQAPAAKELEKSCYVEPTIFEDVQIQMKIAQEEIFGPVLAVTMWDDEEKMLEQANGVQYGLCGGIWTSNLRTAHKTAQRLEAGYIWINQYDVYPYGAPFGGYKQSGVGRELAAETILHYTQQKNVNIDLSGKGVKWFR